MPRTKRLPIPLILLLMALLLMGIIAAQSWLAGDKDLSANENGASIFLAVDRGTVLQSGDCVQARWQVDGIREIYLNNVPQVGTGEQEICVWAERQPTLNITFQDGTEKDYVLPVRILSNSVLNWGLGLVALVLMLVAGYLMLVKAMGDPQTPAPMWGRNLLQGCFITLLSVVIGLVVLEIGMRTYFRESGTEADRTAYVRSRAEIRDLDSLVMPMPYVNYLPDPDNDDHNALGYRGEEITLPKPAGVFRIVALGGSTTYSTGTTAEDAYPAQLQSILRREYGYENVEVINAGFLGYSTWETLVTLAFRVIELEPDMILLYQGVNDILPREQGAADCYAGNNIWRGINVSRGYWVQRDGDLPPSTLYRFLAINLGWMENPNTLDSSFELPDVDCVRDDPNITPEERLANNPPIYYARNLRNIIAIAEVNGIQPVMSTWVYNVQAERPESWQTGIAQHNDVVRDVAAELDVPLIDLVESFPVDSGLWEPDGIHLIAPGTREQAQQYAAFLDAQGLIR